MLLPPWTRSEFSLSSAFTFELGKWAGVYNLSFLSQGRIHKVSLESGKLKMMSALFVHPSTVKVADRIDTGVFLGCFLLFILHLFISVILSYVLRRLKNRLTAAVEDWVAFLISRTRRTTG